MLVSLCSWHYDGVIVLVSLCWCHYAGVIMLVSLCWCHYAGVIMLVSLCWCHYAGVIMLVSLYCCHYTGVIILMSLCWCHYAECRNSFIIMLSVVMAIVFMLARLSFGAQTCLATLHWKSDAEIDLSSRLLCFKFFVCRFKKSFSRKFQSCKTWTLLAKTLWAIYSRNCSKHISETDTAINCPSPGT
jgi:hypothetical protein